MFALLRKAFELASAAGAAAAAAALDGRRRGARVRRGRSWPRPWSRSPIAIALGGARRLARDRDRRRRSPSGRLRLAALAWQSLTSARAVREALAELEPPEDEQRSRLPAQPPAAAAADALAARCPPPARGRVRAPRRPAAAASTSTSRGRRRSALRPGDRPGPRRRLDRRHPLRAGDPAAQPPRRPRLGRLQHRLPAQPGGDLPRPRGRRQAGDRLGSRARRRVRRRPGLHLHHRRLGGRAPVRARGADRRRPGLPARVRGRRHLGRRRGARSTASTTSPTPRATTTTSCAWVLEELVFKARLEDEPRALPRRFADLPRARRRAAVLRPARRPRHARPGRRRAAASSSACARSPSSPVVYAELAGAEHAFDILPSVRTARVVETIERFLATIRAAERRRCSGRRARRSRGCDRLGSRRDDQPSGGDPWT